MSLRQLHLAWRENVAFALTAMRGQKLRSFLTLLGVMAGVATVIMMVSFVVGFNNQIRKAFTSFGAHLVQFQKWEPRFGPDDIPEEVRNRRDLTYDDALALRRLSRLAAAVSPERYLFRSLPVQNGRLEANSPLILGATPDYPEANTHWVQDGRFFTEADVQHAARVAPDVSKICIRTGDALYQFGEHALQFLGRVATAEDGVDRRLQLRRNDVQQSGDMVLQFPRGSGLEHRLYGAGEERHRRRCVGELEQACQFVFECGRIAQFLHFVRQRIFEPRVEAIEVHRYAYACRQCLASCFEARRCLDQLLKIPAIRIA